MGANPFTFHVNYPLWFDLGERFLELGRPFIITLEQTLALKSHLLKLELCKRTLPEPRNWLERWIRRRMMQHLDSEIHAVSMLIDLHTIAIGVLPAGEGKPWEPAG